MLKMDLEERCEVNTAIPAGLLSAKPSLRVSIVKFSFSAIFEGDKGEKSARPYDSQMIWASSGIEIRK
jgi:hypothetical protein